VPLLGNQDEFEFRFGEQAQLVGNTFTKENTRERKEKKTEIRRKGTCDVVLEHRNHVVCAPSARQPSNLKFPFPSSLFPISFVIFPIFHFTFLQAELILKYKCSFRSSEKLKEDQRREPG
jgi:hypothetical protein